MENNFKDCIKLRRIPLSCKIGWLKDERSNHQQLWLDLDLYIDTRAAGQSDKLTDTFDYRRIQEMQNTINSISFHLIEKLAQYCADFMLKDTRITSVGVTIHKTPADLGIEASVAILRP